MDFNEYIKEQLKEEVNCYDELKSLLKTLNANETKVGKEVLLTRYKKPYEELQEKILICVMVIALKEIQNVLYFHKEDSDVMDDTSNKVSEFIKSSKEIKLITEKIKEEYTLNNWFYEEIDKIKNDVVVLFYLDYWFSKIEYDEERNMYYSYISKMWYDGKNWVRPFDKAFERDGEEFILKADDSCIYGLPAYKEDVCNYPEYSLYQTRAIA